MGSRIGYCVKDKEGRSPIFRKQWASSIKEAVINMWNNLGGIVDDGCQAIRSDLSKERGFASLCYSIYQPPFNSIEPDSNCDIGDNGLIEIDISNYKNWIIYHIEIGNYDELRRKYKDFEKNYKKYKTKVNWTKECKKTKIAQMNEKGFKWLITDKTRAKLGEGLC
jgi:hypothetical protein